MLLPRRIVTSKREEEDVSSRTAIAAEQVTPSVRQVLSRIAPEMPLFDVQSMDDRIADSLVSRRIPLMLLLVFAGVALFLAAVGISGALASSVAQRTRELGIRLAMGSTPEDVFRLVVSQGFKVIGLGLVLGVVTWESPACSNRCSSGSSRRTFG